MTIHITPEPEFSYVSFESNIPLASYLDVIQRVLDTFLPGKFILTIFANRVRIFITAYYLILFLNCDLTIMAILHLKFLLFFYVDIHGGRFTQGTAKECYLRKLGEKGHTVQPISKLRADIRALCKVSNTIFLRDLAAWVKP